MDTEVKKIHSPLFPVSKQEDGLEKFLVFGVPLVPDVPDLQGDVISAEEIEDAAHDFMLVSQELGTDHTELQQGLAIVQSFIAPVNFTLGGKKVVKGSWVIVVKVKDTEIWQKIKLGEFGGFSIQGRSQVETLAA